MNKRFVAFLLFGFLLVGAAELDLRKRVFVPAKKLDRFWVDFCLGNSGTKIGNPSVTMVRITDDYEPVQIGRSTGEGALSKLDYGTFLYAIGKLQPGAVSFMPSPVFESNSVLNDTSIYPLKDAALQLPRMTLGTVVSNKGAPANSAEAVQYPGLQVAGDISSLPNFTRTVRPADPDLMVNGDPAFVSSESFTSGADGRQVRVQLIARQGDRVVPGFIIASVANQAGVGYDDISVNLESSRPKIRIGDSYIIPISEDGTMKIPSHGGLSHAMYEVLSTDKDGKEKRKYHFASLKVEDVALAAKRNDAIAKTIYDEFVGKFDSLSNNLILVGIDRTSDRTILTQNDEWLSPMYATARAIATIQSGRYTARWPMWARVVAYLSIFTLALLLLKLKRGRVLFIFATAVVFVISMVMIFRLTLTWSPPLGMFALFGLMLFIGLFADKSSVIEDLDSSDDQLPA